jgi:glycosyltransferase 2 family protein
MPDRQTASSSGTRIGAAGPGNAIGIRAAGESDHRQSADPGQPRPAGPGGAPRWVTARLRAWSTRGGRLLASPLARWGFVVTTVALGGWAVAREWAGVRSALASLGITVLAAALLCVLAALLATMCAWRVLLAGLGSPLPVPAAGRILFIGQLGKYLPGSVWPILAQMQLGQAYGVPRHRSATASVLTMLASLFTGLVTALVTLPFVAGGTPYRWAFAALPVLLICLSPRVLNALLGWLLRLARRPALERPLRGRVLAAALAWSFLAWLLYGLQVWLLATRLGAAPGTAALLATGGFAFAWCVGFLVVLAPAGAGIRDVLLVAVLSPVLGTGAATAVALMSRIMTIVGDLAAAAGAALSARRGRAQTGK